jgi:hypothetical protein
MTEGMKNAKRMNSAAQFQSYSQCFRSFHAQSTRDMTDLLRISNNLRHQNYGTCCVTAANNAVENQNRVPLVLY